TVLDGPQRSGMAGFGNNVVFPRLRGGAYELWSTDGSSAFRLKAFSSTAGFHPPINLSVVGKSLYFQVPLIAGGSTSYVTYRSDAFFPNSQGLWYTDGSPAGNGSATRFVSDIGVPSPATSGVYSGQPTAALAPGNVAVFRVQARAPGAIQTWTADAGASLFGT